MVLKSDNNRRGAEQSRSGFEWRRIPRDLFRRRRLFWISDKTKGKFGDSCGREDAFRYNLL